MNTSQVRSNCEPARRNCCGTRVTSDTECLCCAALDVLHRPRHPQPYARTFNEVYKRFLPKNPPARIFFCVSEWTGPFDVEVDCIAVTKD